MADRKVSELTNLAAPASTDLVYVVHDPSGTPTPRQSTVAQLLGTSVLRTRTPLNLKDYGAVGDGVTDDTTAVTNWLTDVAAAKHAGFVPGGDYLTSKFSIPENVREVFGEGAGATSFINKDTNGNVFVTCKASRCLIRDLTIDGKRAANTGGLAGLQFSRPNAAVADASSIAGGLILNAGVSAGATSVVLTSLHSLVIVPGDVLTFTESGKMVEQARVARSYAGGTTVALADALTQAFTTAATVTLAMTDVAVVGCEVLSNGRDGIAFWHAIDFTAEGNWVRDCSDTAIDCPSGGSRHGTIHNNHIDTNGQWGVALDGVGADDGHFGQVGYITVSDNHIRFKSGGATAPTDGVYLGDVLGPKVRNNTIDLSLVGLVGVRVASTMCLDPDISGNTIFGKYTSPRANTFGVRSTAGAWDGRPSVNGNVCRDLESGIDLGAVRSAALGSNKVFSASNYGITVLGDATNVQKITYTANHTDTTTVGLRWGGTPNAGNAVAATGNVNTNASFTPMIADAGWNVTNTGNV